MPKRIKVVCRICGLSFYAITHKVGDGTIFYPIPHKLLSDFRLKGVRKPICSGSYMEGLVENNHVFLDENS